METWRAIPGWEGLYEASDAGRIRSTPRQTVTPRGVRHFPGWLLKPSPNERGYLKVNLSRNGKGRTQKVHQLVAATFLGERPEGMNVCHNDGTKTNNAASNLRYDTPQANSLDVVAHGHHPNANLTHCFRGHPFDEENTYRRPSRPTRRACRTCRGYGVKAA